VNTDNPRGGRIDARVEIGGDQSGQIAVGNDIAQQTIRGLPPTDEEIAKLREQFRDLLRRVTEEAPPEMREEAQAKVIELESAVIADEPDLTTMEYLRNWFLKRLPSIVGAVTGVIVNPIVGKLVGAAGDGLVAEFRRRFAGQ
jgi:hypothetical protein